MTLKAALETTNQQLLNLQQKCGVQPTPSEYEPEVTIVIYKMPYSEGEDVNRKVSHLLEVGVGVMGIVPVRCKRTPLRNGRPGVVKAEFSCLQDKLTVLRSKSNLKTCSTIMYRDIYMRSSKSHMERLIELNFKTVLDELPNGRNYRVTGNGKVVKHSDSGTTSSYTVPRTLQHPTQQIPQAGPSWQNNGPTPGSLPYPVDSGRPVTYSAAMQTSPLHSQPVSHGPY